MKPLSFLSVSCVFLLSRVDPVFSSPFQPVPRSAFTTPSPTGKSPDFLVEIRGGAETGAINAETTSTETAIDLELVSNALVYLFGAMNVFHGFILACVPSLGTSILGTSADKDDNMAYAEEAVGAFALEYGVTGFLAASGTVEPAKAIGYGTLPDILFMVKNLVNGKFAKMGVAPLLTGATLIVAISTALIFTDKLHVGPVLEVLTIVPATQGIMKYLFPVTSGKSMMGTDLSEKLIAKSLYSMSGQMKIVSAVLRGCIAAGVSPIRALGYSVLTNAALTSYSLLIKKDADNFESKQAFYHHVGALLLSFGMGAVFTLHKKV